LARAEARRLCLFLRMFALHLAFAFSPISTASRASLSALRRLWFAWNSGSAWLSDIVCLDESGWRARRSSSSATCCSADRFGLVICFFPSTRARPGGGSSVILPLQKHPYQENQGTNNPEEGLGILGPLPVLHFAFAFNPSCKAYGAKLEPRRNREEADVVRTERGFG